MSGFLLNALYLAAVVITVAVLVWLNKQYSKYSS